jgi:hypothetical protein
MDGWKGGREGGSGFWVIDLIWLCDWRIPVGTSGQEEDPTSIWPDFEDRGLYIYLFYHSSAILADITVRVPLLENSNWLNLNPEKKAFAGTAQKTKIVQRPLAALRTHTLDSDNGRKSNDLYGSPTDIQES